MDFITGDKRREKAMHTDLPLRAVRKIAQR